MQEALENLWQCRKSHTREYIDEPRNAGLEGIDLFPFHLYSFQHCMTERIGGSMFRYVNPNGEELPSSGMIFNVEELPVLFKVVNDIFEHLDSSIIRMPVYGVRINVSNPTYMNAALQEMMRKYPFIYLYTVDNRSLFEMRGPSGGIVTSQIFYILKRSDGHAISKDTDQRSHAG